MYPSSIAWLASSRIRFSASFKPVEPVAALKHVDMVFAFTPGLSDALILAKSSFLKIG